MFSFFKRKDKNLDPINFDSLVCDMHSHLIAVLRSLDTWCSEFNYSIAEQVPNSSSHITQQDTDIVNALFAADSLVNGTRDSIAKALDVPQIA